MRGKLGNTVFSRTRNGSTARALVPVKNPHTAAQVNARTAFTKAQAAQRTLTATQIGAWQTYANGLVKHDPVTLQSYVPVWNEIFTGLASKFLQFNPTGTIPTAAPTGAFVGDSITVTATGGIAQVTFTGSGANALFVKTELLLQPLKSKLRTPAPDKYKSKGFVAYAAGGLTTTVIATAGYYAAAYRFVNLQTGQETLLQPLGIVQVS